MNIRRLMSVSLMSAVLLSALAAMSASAGPPPLSPQRITQAHRIGTLAFSLGGNPTNGRPSTDARRRSLLNRRVPRNGRARPDLAIPSTEGNNIAASNPHLRVMNGVNGHDQYGSWGVTFEPPDQALCVSKDFIVEAVNSVLRVDRTDLTTYSAVINLNTFFGLPLYQFTSDPRCYYDPDTRRWFVTQLLIDSDQNFNFIGTSHQLIAVSQTPSPVGTWNLYSFETTDASRSGCPCFGDFPMIGADTNGFFISTNEYSIFGPEFYGTQLYAVDKAGLAAGLALVTVDNLQIGPSVANPDGPCTGSSATCWNTLQPAASASAVYDSRFGGTEYLTSALDFGGTLDNRVALWAVSNTITLRGLAPALGLYDDVIASETYGLPNMAAQKSGPIPYGDSLGSSEGPIQTNSDYMQPAAFAHGLIWSGLNTIINVPSPHVPAAHAGIAYWAIQPDWSSGFKGIIKQQGYVAAKGEDVAFPSVALTTHGKGVMTFTLTGPDYYPSSAYVTLKVGKSASDIHIAALGAAPYDGDTEYSTVPFYDPRWGDYSAAAAIPSGDEVFIASEYIQTSCTDAVWNVDPTCGGTRGPTANWGTIIGRVIP
jgi:hypothetical protein